MKKVTMYSGDPCPYCGAAKALLKTKNVEIEEFDIWKDPAKAKEMLQRTNGARTIPQIFIGDHYIGGNDQLQAANRSGELDTFLIFGCLLSRFAKFNASLMDLFLDKAKANPPLNASPAPVVSIAFTEVAFK